MNNVKKGFLFSLCFVCWTAVLSSQALAITTSFVPSGSIVNIGDSVDIDVFISGMESVDLGAFDFNINYDDTILGFNSYSLGSGLGDISAFDAIDLSWGDLGGGMINLAEVSLLLDLSSQPHAFTLATVSFTGISLGTSALSFSGVTFGDDRGDPLFTSLGTGSVASVPDASIILLLGSSLMGLAVFSRKSKRS